jgi:hypothetical protein
MKKCKNVFCSHYKARKLTKPEYETNMCWVHIDIATCEHYVDFSRFLSACPEISLYVHVQIERKEDA